MFSDFNATGIFEDLMIEAKYYYIFSNYFFGSLFLGMSTYVYYKYRQDPKGVLRHIFDKGTNAYTFSRLCCNDVYKRLSLIKNGEITQKILKIYLVKGSDILDLSSEYNAENLGDFDWDKHMKHHQTITDAPRLEIVYEIAGEECNQYIALVPYKSKPKFPIYTSDQLKKLNSEWDHWEDLLIDPVPEEEETTSNCSETASSVGLVDRVWKELEKYAGPCGNFYEDLKDRDLVRVRGDWILDHNYDPPVPILESETKLSLLDTLGDKLNFF